MSSSSEDVTASFCLVVHAQCEDFKGLGSRILGFRDFGVQGFRVLGLEFYFFSWFWVFLGVFQILGSSGRFPTQRVLGAFSAPGRKDARPADFGVHSGPNLQKPRNPVTGITQRPKP